MDRAGRRWQSAKHSPEVALLWDLLDLESSIHRKEA